MDGRVIRTEAELAREPHVITTLGLAPAVTTKATAINEGSELLTLEDFGLI